MKDSLNRECPFSHLPETKTIAHTCNPVVRPSNRPRCRSACPQFREFEASLVYVVSSRTAGVQRDGFKSKGLKLNATLIYILTLLLKTKKWAKQCLWKVFLLHLISTEIISLESPWSWISKHRDTTAPWRLLHPIRHFVIKKKWRSLEGKMKWKANSKLFDLVSNERMKESKEEEGTSIIVNVIHIWDRGGQRQQIGSNVRREMLWQQSELILHNNLPVGKESSQFSLENNLFKILVKSIILHSLAAFSCECWQPYDRQSVRKGGWSHSICFPWNTIKRPL